MKFSVPLTILAVAASVDAAAVADQEKRYCSAEGQACDTVKRAAEAFSDVLSANTNLPTRAESGSEVASIAARQLRELALAIAASHGDPTAYFNALGYGAPKTEKRDADPWCDQFLGGSCLASRDTSPAKRDAQQGWCTQFPGMPCWKRSTPEQGAEEAKRDAQQGWCTQFPGMPCWKRDGPSLTAVDKREAQQGWCTQFPGMPCWKRDAACHGPAGACTKATRDLHAIYNAARTIIEA